MPDGRLVYDRGPEVVAWVADRLFGGGETFGQHTAIGFERDGVLLAGFVFNEYIPDYRTIQIQMAADSPTWARRRTIREILAYPFFQLGVFKVWCAVRSGNAHGLKTFGHVGFKREATLAHHYGPKQHAVICRMFRPDFDRLYGD